MIAGWLAASGCTPQARVDYLAPPASLTSGDGHTSFATLGLDQALRSVRAADVAPVAAPIELTSTDGYGLGLVRLSARTVVTGPLALTELRMTFRNPEARQREGRFAIDLPPGAAVNRLAMKIRGQWMESEVVERARARAIFEEHKVIRRDPILLEKDIGDRFTARVYPIEANEDKEVIIGFVSSVTARAPLRVALAGLPVLERFDVEVYGAGAPIVRRERGVAPREDLVITPASVARDAIFAAGKHVVALYTPTAASTPAPVEGLVVLIDTSASRARLLGAQAEAVRAIATQLGDAGLTVATFDQAVLPLYAGSARGFGATQVQAIVDRGALGAGNLEAALRWARDRGDRVLIVGDGIASLGARDVTTLRGILGESTRLDALLLGGRGDRATLDALTASGTRHGMVLTDDEDATAWHRRLSLAVLPGDALAIEGAAWTWPSRLQSVQPGDPVLVFAELNAVPGPNLALTVGSTRMTFDPQPLEGPLLARAAAVADIARLRRAASLAAPKQAAALRAQLLETALAHRIITDETSLLVLETEADYARFGLERNGLHDLLAITGDRIAVIQRGARPAAKRAPAAPAVHTTTRTAATGTVFGEVVEQSDGSPLSGVTVVGSSSGVSGTVTEITDDNGRFSLALGAGTWTLSFYYGEAEHRVNNVEVRANAPVSLTTRLDTSDANNVIEVTDSAPTIDPTSTTQGISLSVEFTRNIPTGRTFEAALGRAAGSQSDSMGVAFSGSSSLENQYFVDGINTTGLLSGEWTQPREAPPNAIDRRYRALLTQISRGKAGDALAQATAWLREQPGHTVAFLALGEALEALGRPALAARAYGSIIDLAGRDAALIRGAGMRLDRLGRPAQALAIAAYRLAERERETFAGTRLLAWSLVSAGQYGEAAELLVKAIALAPNHDLQRLVRDDFGVVAALAAGASPDERAAIEARAIALGVDLAQAPSTRVIMTWEGARDLELSLHDSDGEIFDYDVRRTDRLRLPSAEVDVGMEGLLALTGAPQVARADVMLRAHGFEGFAVGKLTIVQFDGDRGLTIEDRTFALIAEGSSVALGNVALRPVVPAASGPVALPRAEALR